VPVPGIGGRPSGPDEPSAARMASYWLGGTDNTEADRARAAEIEAIEPGVRAMTRSRRLFAARAVGYAARFVRQVADLGCGFPAPEKTHEIARSVRPSAVCAYVEDDPEAFDATDAVLGGEPGLAVVRTDLRDPAAVLADPGLCKVIDVGEPLMLLFGFSLHFMDAATAAELVAAYAGLVAPGSFLAVSVSRTDDAGLAARLAEAYTPAPLHNFSEQEFADLFSGLELVPPGIAPAVHLRPGWEQVPLTPPGPAYVLGALARKRLSSAVVPAPARRLRTRTPMATLAALARTPRRAAGGRRARSPRSRCRGKCAPWRCPH
jgi:hypothetical protein